MRTQTRQLLSKLVDIDDISKDFSNPVIKAFKQKGQVFGFVAPFIVADELQLTHSNINGADLLVDADGLTYKINTTPDVAPAFTKGYGRSKDGIDTKNILILMCDRVCILEQPKGGKSILTVFKTTDLILDNKGCIV